MGCCTEKTSLPYVTEQYNQKDEIFYKAEGWVPCGVTVMVQKSSRRKELIPKRGRNGSIFSRIVSALTAKSKYFQLVEKVSVICRFSFSVSLPLLKNEQEVVQLEKENRVCQQPLHLLLKVSAFF
ncbi:hypothetical protein SAMN05421852_12726 [Thermoflavimicrobium dichotomicum]|uniref:Uncharacterized protein n=1 Tax=Thermoflavimicrobium dichotomicum TaxID=46223 RepID=A0A1I3UQR7_9BACL|nr:hypothetical protein SAMN05421852_12726 [Thermoflavimicrobium dichotomicum]